MDNLIEIIQEHSLTVRCLPYVVVNHWTYKEGDEERIKKPSYDAIGNIRDVKQSIVFNERWNRKMLREERQVEHGGWWYVKETKHTDSTVRFNREYDKFFASTLEEAISMYLNSLKK